MIVEFIGCSGAGKTTLARAVTDEGVPGGTVMASDLAMNRAGRWLISSPKAINFVDDLRAVPWFLRTMGGNRAFVRFAFDRLRHAPSTFARLNYKRGIIRRVGLHELAKGRGGSTPILLDEGVVLIAYHLFVYSDTPWTQLELERFASLVPLPDRIVYVKAPVDSLVDRAMDRPDRRRELTSNDRGEIQDLIERATAVFDGLASCDVFRDRMVIVDNPNGAGEERDMLTRRVANLIYEWQSSNDDAASPTPPHSTGP